MLMMLKRIPKSLPLVCFDRHRKESKGTPPTCTTQTYQPGRGSASGDAQDSAALAIGFFSGIFEIPQKSIFRQNGAHTTALKGH